MGWEDTVEQRVSIIGVHIGVYNRGTWDHWVWGRTVIGVGGYGNTMPLEGLHWCGSAIFFKWYRSFLHPSIHYSCLSIMHGVHARWGLTRGARNHDRNHCFPNLTAYISAFICYDMPPNYGIISYDMPPTRPRPDRGELTPRSHSPVNAVWLWAWTTSRNLIWARLGQGRRATESSFSHFLPRPGVQGEKPRSISNMSNTYRPLFKRCSSDVIWNAWKAASGHGIAVAFTLHSKTLSTMPEL